MIIALFGREIDCNSRKKLERMLNAFIKRGAGLVFYEPFYWFLKKTCEIDLADFPLYNSAQDIPQDTAVMLSIGGDGTFLSAVALIKDRDIPIAGVNFGRLGFLTTILPDENDQWIDALFDGMYNIENRMLLKTSSQSMPEGFYPYAVNEVCIQRNTPSMLGVRVLVNGKELPVYWSDGIVISTPTGSTAYNLSVGGPVVDPTSKVLIISPIAPHNLNIRPLVVPSDTVIEISSQSRGRRSIVSVDNRYFEMEDNGKVFVSMAEFGYRIISFSNNTFIKALKEKLLWGEDKRNS